MRSLLIVACVALASGLARADDPWKSPAGDESRDAPDLSYLYDGGAIPLFWIPLVGGVLVSADVAPRSTPLLFDPHDGGAPPASWEIPGWSLALTGAGVAAVIGFASHDSARWYHVKGIAEALATSALVVAVAKPIFGRHRPDWTSTTTDPDESQSFPSGHATAAFSIATYSALYLHGHVWADEPTTATHALAYVGLFAGALFVDDERIYHDRHYVSDVVAGSLLGSVTSVVIYRYQEARASGAQSHDWAIAPSVAAHSPAVSIMGSF
jgi:membrane-associated phospholipid phosphatase